MKLNNEENALKNDFELSAIEHIYYVNCDAILSLMEEIKQ